MAPNSLHVGRFECYRNRVRMSTADNQLRPDTVNQYNVIDVVYVIILIAYFLHFALPALGGGFEEDEIINIWTHWFSGVSKSVWANICFWKGIGRPAGAIYYLTLYHFFGMNPQPYRIAQMSILAGSIPIVYHLARLLFSSRSIAFLAVLAFCYHAKLANLLLGPFCYDVLCGFFYFAALTYYIHIREKGFRLRPIQWLGFLALYICALNAKEMAVTLPVVVFVYELLKYRRGVERPRFSRWILHYASPALLAGVITAIYCYNKVYGSGLIGPFGIRTVDYRTKATTLDAGVAALFEFYMPRYSWPRFMESNARYASELFYLAPKHVLSGEMLLAIWALLFTYAFLRRDHALQLMAFWAVITPLPLAFLTPRVGGRLYIPLFGWAMIFAKVVSDIITSMYKSLILLSQSARRPPQLQQSSAGRADSGRVREAPIRTTARSVLGKVSPATFQACAAILIAFGLAAFTQWENQRLGVNRAFLNSGQKTLHVIQALRALNLHPSPGSMILLRPEKEFYQNGYYPGYFASLAQDNPLRQLVVKLSPRYWYYVASLVWGDRSLQIQVEDQHQLIEEQLAKFQYVISFDEFQAKLIRGSSTD
jgi:hypothetical protein